MGQHLNFGLLVQKNITKFHDIKEWWTICYGHKTFGEENMSLLEVAEHFLPPEPWDESTFQTWMNEVKEETGLKRKGPLYAYKARAHRTRTWP